MVVRPPRRNRPSSTVELAQHASCSSTATTSCCRTSWADGRISAARSCAGPWREGGYHDGGPLRACVPLSRRRPRPRPRCSSTAGRGAARGGRLARTAARSPSGSISGATGCGSATLAPGARHVLRARGRWPSDARTRPLGGDERARRRRCSLYCMPGRALRAPPAPAGAPLGRRSSSRPRRRCRRRSLSVAADGAVVVGYQALRPACRAHRREARQGLSRSYPVQRSPHPQISFAVGMDAGRKRRGGVGGRSHDQVGSAAIAFKPRDAAGFGPPRDTGVVTIVIDQRDLVVDRPRGADHRAHHVPGSRAGRNPDRTVAFFGDTPARAARTVTPLSKDGYGKLGSARTSAVTRSSCATS